VILRLSGSTPTDLWEEFDGFDIGRKEKGELIWTTSNTPALSYLHISIPFIMTWHTMHGTVVKANRLGNQYHAGHALTFMRKARTLTLRGRRRVAWTCDDLTTCHSRTDFRYSIKNNQSVCIRPYLLRLTVYGIREQVLVIQCSLLLITACCVCGWRWDYFVIRLLDCHNPIVVPAMFGVWL